MTLGPDDGGSEDSTAGFRFLGGPEPLHDALHGLKAAWLDRAQRAGERVPEAFVVDVHCAQRLSAGDPAACRALHGALARLCSRLSGSELASGAAPRLAVRASPALSLPGALLTRLDVPAELDSVLTALREVVGSALSSEVREQLEARGEVAPGEPWLAVLVQRYLPTSADSDFGAVAFTCDPLSGRHVLCGEYARSGAADVASGRTRPDALEAGHSRRALAQQDAEAYAQLQALGRRLEACFQEPLELELVRVADRVWLLQVRQLALSPRALVQLSLEAIEDDSPSHARWLEQLARLGDALFEQHFAPAATKQAPLMRGLAASPGAASGVLVTDVERAVERARHDPVVLMRTDAVPEDVRAFRAARAVITSSGGLTCHAAVIARGLGIPAVVGCGDVRVDTLHGRVFGARGGPPLLSEGDWVSVDARAGLVYRGALPQLMRIADPQLKRLFAEVRKLRPAPLWVFGEAETALRLKQDACLDGALCTLPPGVEAPAPLGRECWLELQVAEVDARFTTLPAGWGVVLRGDLSRISIAALRKLSPLRALGVRLEHPEASVPAGRLDVVVVTCSGREMLDDAHHRSLEARIDAARLLYLMNFSEPSCVASTSAWELAASSVRANVGWVYSASQAAVGALRDAANRAERAARRS